MKKLLYNFVKKNIIYISLLFALVNISYIIIFFNKYKYLPSPFLMDKNNTFMDFYNPLYWSINNTAYTIYKSVYPPLSFILLECFEPLISVNNYPSSFDLRAANTQISSILLFTYLAIVFFSVNSHLWKSLVPSITNRIIIFITLIFSSPILFSFERGNIIFIAIPLLTILVQSRSELIKYISLGFLVNIKPYFIIYLVSKINEINVNKYYLLKYILVISGIFLTTSYIYHLDLYSYIHTFFDFSKKSPIPFYEKLAMPVSLNALSSFRDYSEKTRHYAFIFYLPTILNTLTIIYLSYLLAFKSLGINNYIIGSILIILNFSSNLGGYSYLFYIPIIPLLLQDKNCKKYLFLIFTIFVIPLDLIKIGSLHNNIFSSVNSYLGQVALNDIVHSFTLGSIIRPIANYLVLLIFTTSLPHANNNNLIFNLKRVIKFFDNISKSLPHIRPKTIEIISFLCLICICIFYNILFSFGSPPITEGWFLTMAYLINSGKVPYLDFNLYLTPLYPLLIAWFSQIFGESLYSLRIFGLLITTGIWCMLYLLLRRRFAPSSSLLASATAMIYYESGVAFISYDFTQFFIFFFLCSTYLLTLSASRGVASQKSQIKDFIFLFFAGFFSSISFLIKQSNGSFAVLFSLICVILTLSRYRENRIPLFVTFVAGGLFPAGAIAIWLSNNSALLDFFNQIFFEAIAAKGTSRQIFFAWFPRIFANNFNKNFILIIFYLLLTVSLYYLAIKIYPIRPKELNIHNSYLFQTVIFFVCVALTIYLSYFYPNQSISRHLFKYGSSYSAFISPFSILTLFLMLLIPSLRMFNLKITFPKEFNGLTISAIMGVGLIWGNGTSGGISEMSLFLPLAIFLCLCLEVKIFKLIPVLVTLLFAMSLICHYSITKFNTPYNWWGLKEDDARSTIHKSDIPIIRNLRLSAREKDIFEGLTNELQKNTSGDIFAFPSIPIVYLISNRWPNSKVLVQWFDFLPDLTASKEAARIMETPPKTIVNLTLPEYVWDAHENIFRQGQKSGQRDIQNTIDFLTRKEGAYTLTYSKKISEGYTLAVWDLKVGK